MMFISRTHNDEETRAVRQKLIEYNARNIPSQLDANYEQVSFIVKDYGDVVVGGIIGYWLWDHIHIDILFVDERLRGLGYGIKLLQEIEKIAEQKQCRYIELDTFSFQAPDFYQKHGYQVVGKVERAVDDHARYYLVKWLPV